jgi:hypothetical protein
MGLKNTKSVQMYSAYTFGFKTVKLYLTGILLSLLILDSCTFRNEEKLEFLPCDTTNITYASVKPIFDNNCVGCHNGQLNYVAINLSSYATAKAAAQTGLLYKAVNHIAGPGITFMPFQRPKLDECDVRKISIWITTNTPQ